MGCRHFVMRSMAITWAEKSGGNGILPGLHRLQSRTPIVEEEAEWERLETWTCRPGCDKMHIHDRKLVDKFSKHSEPKWSRSTWKHTYSRGPESGADTSAKWSFLKMVEISLFWQTAPKKSWSGGRPKPNRTDLSTSKLPTTQHLLRGCATARRKVAFCPRNFRRNDSSNWK